MTWTYDNSPGTSTAAERRDAVRLFLGDTDTSDQQVTDEEITFALAEANDNIYRATSLCADALHGKYSRMVDTAFEGVRSSYSQRADHYRKLAAKYEKKAKTNSGLGANFGGTSKAEIESVNEDDDRVKPTFRRGQFRNPAFNDIDQDLDDLVN
jgi:hypothetical protein